MAKKSKTIFVCQNCGYESPKWMGQCICGEWNTMIEEKIPEITSHKPASRSGGMLPKATKLAEVSSCSHNRVDTDIGELNRVLGGGLVIGSLTLISGEPGIGKSTLILQTASNIANNSATVLYVSGEESKEQIRLRADRVCGGLPPTLYILTETNMENIEAVCAELKPKFLIIDSIQTMYTNEIDSSPGSVSQVRACGSRLMHLGKGHHIPILIVAHVTKSGDLAGPKIIEHLVDCVLNFTGERDGDIRILRAFKNRFGSTGEIGAFEMSEPGLTGIENISTVFLEDMDPKAEGSVATACHEGTRPLLLEIQALTAHTNGGFPRRTALGIDTSRLNMILAVLERKAGLNLSAQDVYVNIVGGIKSEGTSADLAVALAIYSSARNKAGKGKTIAIGEIGLTGDLRTVPNADKIAKEAARMGFSRILMPYKSAARITAPPAGIEIVGIKNLREAILQF